MNYQSQMLLGLARKRKSYHSTNLGENAVTTPTVRKQITRAFKHSAAVRAQKPERTLQKESEFCEAEPQTDNETS